MGKSVYLFGVGIASATSPQPDPLFRDAALAFPGTIRLHEGEDQGRLVPSKDKRILTWDDLLAAEAAMLAMGRPAVEDPDSWGCVIFTTGKGTCDSERQQQRTRYWRDDDRPDVRRFMDAVASGAEVVDPFTLLRDLDNVLLWWVCKHYGISGFNLQINQTVRPDYHAFLEAVELLGDGASEKMLVGGSLAHDREAVAAVCRGSEEAARRPDAAVFCCLTAADEAPPGSIAKLSIENVADLSGEERISIRWLEQDTLALSRALLAALTGPGPGPVLAAREHPLAIRVESTDHG